jgi:riboflavin biosynthesis pyrimidine reductase
MAEPDAGTQLTLLDSTGTVVEDRLPDLYAYPPDLTHCWVRSNFISSIDGGATVDGKSGDLAGPGDRALFQIMRDLADIVIVGAGTVRTENYGGVKLSVAVRQARQARGQAEVPPIGIVSQSGNLERDMKVFTQTEVPALVFTCSNVAAVTREHLGDAAEVLDCSGDDAAAVDIAVVLSTLAARGLTRVLTEGGPRLHGTFIEAGLLDELCLSMSPTLVGGQARRIATGITQVHTAMRRAHLLADDAGYLYARYTRES